MYKYKSKKSCFCDDYEYDSYIIEIVNYPKQETSKNESYENYIKTIVIKAQLIIMTIALYPL